MGGLVVECVFPFSQSIHAKKNVPQTKNLLSDESDQNPHTRLLTTCAVSVADTALSPCVSRELWFGCTASLRWKRVCNKIES